MSDVPDVLYIMGFGRAGTTILEILLSSNSGLFGAGELTYIIRDAFIRDVTCSCGRRSSECEVWSRLRGSVPDSQAELLAIAELFLKVQSHGRFPLVAANLYDGERLKRYRDINRLLFERLRTVTGAHAVVDSSKYPGRALTLARSLPEKVRVICLTRSPAGLMTSFQKQHKDEQLPKSVLGTVAYYTYVLTSLRVATWLLGRSNVLHVRYEELVSDPSGTLHRIEDWSGHDLSTARQIVATDGWFDVGHIVTGNRLRKQGQVRFNPGAGAPRLPTLSARLAVRALDLYRRLLGF